MSLATTTVFLYVGLDDQRRISGGDWPAAQGGHFELVDWLEGRAIILERLYDAEFAQLDLCCTFDYEITEPLGAWLYDKPESDESEFVAEARRLVAIEQERS